ncbi:MAG: kynureninase [Pseudomonadales bacterium]|nr:kynureninase [Pseudomonadales bacterium]NIX08296.1 kynureninase [Pseudomonadales bacterium]
MRERCLELDAHDPLGRSREAFDLPADRIYLDGNSLGALPRAVPERLRTVIDEEWGRTLIGSWNQHDWINLPVTVGEKIAPLVGAGPGQVLCTDSISVNLYKLLSAALALQPGRRVIVSQGDNFPTDLYMAQGLATELGSERCELRIVDADGIEDALDSDVAVLMLTHADFRTGRLHDMKRMTVVARERGVLTLWDLAHSAGVVPVSLDDWGVDMAVGCGYKFLNGGPGAPAFLYLAERHQSTARQPLTGWMGHGDAFEFSPRYRPADGVRRFLSGTPGILGMCALDAALDVYSGVTVEQSRKKSLALTDLFIEAVDACGDLAQLELLTPRDHDARASQVSLAHPEGWGISQALIDAGIIVDFRAPDIVRFGFAPLYNRYLDVADAVGVLADVMTSKRYRDPRFQARKRVT